MYLEITNAGEMDPRALTLHGASTKRGENDMIGKFGSGNKYALATLLRKGHEVLIFSGEKQITIETMPETFRDQNFNVLIINGGRTSITIETGPDWETRDAIREFWCNALDEGGAKLMQVYDPSPQVGVTKVYISINDALKNMLDNWELYFLNLETAIYSCEYGSIHKTPVTNFYRKGVWICEDHAITSLFSYNFNNIDLPESRKISSHSTKYALSSLFDECNVPEICDALMKAAQSSTPSIEWSSLDWSLSYAFKDNMEAHLKKRGYLFTGDMTFKHLIPENEHSVVFWAQPTKFNVLKQILPSIHEENSHSKGYEIVPWPIGVKDRVDQAVNKLRAFGVDLTGHKIAFATFENPDVIARADIHNDYCLISYQAINANSTMLEKALIEEWTHLAHGVMDGTTAQQHVYLDLIVALMNRKV